MILTCPACSTNYVVKDGAIPPQGRQVRCAACKHSWHQDGEGAAVVAEAPAEPAPDEHRIDATVDQAPWDHRHDAAMTSSPDDVAAQPAEQSAWGEVTATPLPESFDTTTPVTPPEEMGPFARAATSDAPLHSFAEPRQDAPVEPAAIDPEPIAQAVESEPLPTASADDDFERYSPIIDDEEPRRRRWPWILLLLALIVAAAAAFWFLAPASWKVRAGIAGAAGSALEVKVDSTDRTPLAQSDKDLVTVSGRIINNSDTDQSLPPIHVLLSDKASKKVVHRWTIAPPVATLPPRQATNFNSAEIGVPRTGEDLTVRLGP